VVGNGVRAVVLTLGCIIKQKYSLCFAVRCRKPRCVSLLYLVRHRFPPALVVAIYLLGPGSLLPVSRSSRSRLLNGKIPKSLPFAAKHRSPMAGIGAPEFNLMVPSRLSVLAFRFTPVCKKTKISL
jgi:hypothetical protein